MIRGGGFLAGGGGGGAFGLATGEFFGLMGTTYAISSSSKLSALGSLSEPELASSPSSPPLVIFISCLSYFSSFSISSASINSYYLFSSIY